MGVGNQLHLLRDHPDRRSTSHHCSALALALALSFAIELPLASTAPEPAATASELGSTDPFTPYGRQYALMQEELARYSALADGDNWQPLDPGQPLVPGMRDPRVAQLRSLLMQYGDYSLDDHTAANRRADEYDERLQEAVRRFQRRHGLKEDALVDERTRARLNTSPAKHVQTLSANLERWQQLPKDLGPRYIVVNIPDYSLRLIDGEREQFRMRVVVGKPKHETPQLATRMTRVVFNPIWRVPPNIALRELLPKGSATLSADGYRLVNHSGRAVPFTRRNVAGVRRGKVTLQQKGGPGNALGRVKFVIPNREAIFLHDTNSKHLFKRGQRAFSHGCIRLEKPLEFARMMLAQQNNWSETRIERALLSNRTQGIELENPIPVYIAYWTAWVDEDGLLQFRPDIYGRDEPEAADGSALPSGSREPG
ncbi:L,D-transpeptidase family protein [Microbulbifer marinus]|uniref:Putative peptidoglycan binding domain-containing protein n=1 Tax=Microbulbifer marinus TaxID=658218 RepID=A0A1H3YF16_9GAMM|nr:L,D-transpeptidase family protein [Microbulbifer marinus]SEA10189.1 Putative peptidoglycan binding domain-containing protein [Microbulbifer marinus]